jgi:predicted AAA+ superfamily ATPase
MNSNLIELVEFTNPWLKDISVLLHDNKEYWPRLAESALLAPVWDEFCTILLGPRQVGKTTLGKILAARWCEAGRFETLIYLNCDLADIRSGLEGGPLFIRDLLKRCKLVKPIIFIDEVQRLLEPGLLLKAIIDLNLPIKLLASGSSQLEMRSKMQEFLTGRHMSAVILPFNWEEGPANDFEQRVIYGSYPKLLKSVEKKLILGQLYEDYISKDIIEILRLSRPEAMERLVGLMAHAAGQLVNYESLAKDTQLSAPTVKQYLSVLEKTFVLYRLTPFVGNKRSELTSNPVYYFIDNGFRNQALRNFSNLSNRTDIGLLIQNFVFQEILKYQYSYFKKFNIHYWRTKGGAEVDFVIDFYDHTILPIEIKYQTFRNKKKYKI